MAQQKLKLTKKDCVLLLIPILVVALGFSISINEKYIPTNDGTFIKYSRNLNLEDYNALYHNFTDNQLYIGYVIYDPYNSTEKDVLWSQGSWNITLFGYPQNIIIQSNQIVGYNKGVW